MTKLRRIVTGIFLGAAAVLLLSCSDAVAAGVKDGLSLSAGVLIPSLFPFMILSGFLALSGVGDLVAIPIRPITKRLLKLPNEAGAAVLASFIGGYPTGAKTLASLVEAGKLDRESASRMMRYCVNPGPSFVVIAVGAAMFGSRRLGWIFFLAQALSSLIVGTIAARGMRPAKASPGDPIPLSAAFVASVSNACSGMLSICGYVVLFSAVIRLLGDLGSVCPMPPWVLTLVSGFLEVTAGCALAAKLGGLSGFLLGAFFLSFSGISVICQAASSAVPAGISLKGFFYSRLACGILSMIFSYLFLMLTGTHIAVAAPLTPPVAIASADHVVGAGCLILMAFIVLVSGNNQKLDRKYS